MYVGTWKGPTSLIRRSSTRDRIVIVIVLHKSTPEKPPSFVPFGGVKGSTPRDHLCVILHPTEDPLLNPLVQPPHRETGPRGTHRHVLYEWDEDERKKKKTHTGVGLTLLITASTCLGFVRLFWITLR